MLAPPFYVVHMFCDDFFVFVVPQQSSCTVIYHAICWCGVIAHTCISIQKSSENVPRKTDIFFVQFL